MTDGEPSPGTPYRSARHAANAARATQRPPQPGGAVLRALPAPRLAGLLFVAVVAIPLSQINATIGDRGDVLAPDVDLAEDVCAIALLASSRSSSSAHGAACPRPAPASAARSCGAPRCRGPLRSSASP